ncbi:helix-turn-helix transcriptional regulator, partial [bacterium]|nr:helix-turn-helix transcriptional regulator [bacterium]
IGCFLETEADKQRKIKIKFFNKKEEKISISEIMRKRRNEIGLTIAVCAKEIGVSQSTYREWEYGRAISGEPYAKIASLLGLSLSELLGRDKTELIIKTEEVEEKMEEILQLIKVIKSNL